MELETEVVEEVYEKLDPIFKKKWTGALRSGKYVQATAVLYSPEASVGAKLAMCCLGVAEHIMGTPLKEMNDSSVCFPKDLANPRSPQSLWGKDNDDNLGTHLANMNDGCPSTGVKQHNFEEIANWIDEFL